MRALLLVGLGGALGSMARYGVGLAAASWAGLGFPWGTLAVNVAGSFLIGLALVAGWEPGHFWRLSIMTGFLGGFTTFSAFGGETLALFLASTPGRALLNIGANVILGLAATALGFALGRNLAP